MQRCAGHAHTLIFNIEQDLRPNGVPRRRKGSEIADCWHGRAHRDVHHLNKTTAVSCQRWSMQTAQRCRGKDGLLRVVRLQTGLSGVSALAPYFGQVQAVGATVD